jgi:ABC-type nickel/cobalt efflux system permease component RcnA
LLKCFAFPIKERKVGQTFGAAASLQLGTRDVVVTSLHHHHDHHHHHHHHHHNYYCYYYCYYCCYYYCYYYCYYQATQKGTGSRTKVPRQDRMIAQAALFVMFVLRKLPCHKLCICWGWWGMFENLVSF